MPNDDTPALGYSPTIKKRTLARRLTALRKQCGINHSQACERLEWNPTRLVSIEKATWVNPSSDHVIDLCELYGIEGDEREELLQLTREARQRGWWRKHGFNKVFTTELPGFEAGASKISAFECTLIPGLIQAPGYIELTSRAVGIEQAQEIQRRVAARIERQNVITREENPARLRAVIDENALLRITDPGVRSAQLKHLIDLGERPTVTIQVLRLDTGLYPGNSEPFMILDFDDVSERSIVYLETTIDARMLEERDEIERYRIGFDQLSAAALTPEATRAYLHEQIE